MNFTAVNKYREAIDFVCDLMLHVMEGGEKLKESTKQLFRDMLDEEIRAAAYRKGRLDVLVSVSNKPDYILATAVQRAGIEGVNFKPNSVVWLEEEDITEQVRVRHKVGYCEKVHTTFLPIH